MSHTGQKKISSYITKVKPKDDKEPASKLARKDHVHPMDEGNKKDDEVREKALDESDTTISSRVVTPAEGKTQDSLLGDEQHHAVEIDTEKEETPSTGTQFDILSLKPHSARVFSERWGGTWRRQASRCCEALNPDALRQSIMSVSVPHKRGLLQ